MSAKFRAIRPKLCRNCAFPQNLHTRKSGKITVFFQVVVVRCCFSYLRLLFVINLSSPAAGYFLLVSEIATREDTSVLESLFNKAADLRTATLLKTDSNTGVSVFSCKYCEIFKNTYFEEHLRTAASRLFLLE